jgi:hypothetical protein
MQPAFPGRNVRAGCMAAVEESARGWRGGRTGGGKELEGYSSQKAGLGKARTVKTAAGSERYKATLAGGS